MSTVLVVGMLAATLSVVSFVPQAWKVWRTRHTSSLATSMWIMNTAAFALWTSYGVAVGKIPIIVTNVICFVLAGFILAIKLTSPRTPST